MPSQDDIDHTRNTLLKVFDARYTVAPCPCGGFCVMDNQRSNLEAGPWANKRTAEEVLTFMREHVGVEYA